MNPKASKHANLEAQTRRSNDFHAVTPIMALVLFMVVLVIVFSSG